MNWQASYQLFESGLLFAGLIASLIFLLVRPGAATNFFRVIIPANIATIIAFVAAPFLAASSYRAEIVGALAKELPFMVVIGVMCVVQAEFLQGAIEGHRVRAALYSAPKFLVISWLIALGFGLLWPSPALAMFAPAPLEFVIFKWIFLVPEGLYSLLLSMLFFADVSPRFMMHPWSPVKEVGQKSLEGLRLRSVTTKLRIKSLAFFSSTFCWVLLALNSMYMDVVRWVASVSTRELLLNITTILEFSLILLSILTLLYGLIIFAAQSCKEHLLEQVLKWFALRDRIDLKLWGFRGEKARATFGQKYYIRKACQHLRLPDDRKDMVFLSLKLIALYHSNEVDLQQFKRLNQLHNSLLKHQSISALINRQVDLHGILGVNYEFNRDPMRVCLQGAISIIEVQSKRFGVAQLRDKPQWIQLAAVSAAHAGYLSTKLSRSILEGFVVEKQVLNAFKEALNTSIRERPAMPFKIGPVSNR